MADVILYGQKGGKSTKDATATAEDIRAGLTAYIASGKVTGTLKGEDFVQYAAANLSVSTTTQTVTLGFRPLVVCFVSSGAGYASFTMKQSDGTYKTVLDTSHKYRPAGLSVTDNGFKIVGNDGDGTYGNYYALGV